MSIRVILLSFLFFIITAPWSLSSEVLARYSLNGSFDLTDKAEHVASSTAVSFTYAPSTFTSWGAAMRGQISNAFDVGKYLSFVVSPKDGFDLQALKLEVFMSCYSAGKFGAVRVRTSADNFASDLAIKPDSWVDYFTADASSGAPRFSVDLSHLPPVSDGSIEIRIYLYDVTSLQLPGDTGNMRVSIADLCVMGFVGPDGSLNKNRYDQWLGNFGLRGGDLAPTADPDRDGMVNLLEYAFGAHPTNSQQASAFNPTVRLVESGGVKSMEVSYRRRRESKTLGLSYRVTATADLASPKWVPVAESVISFIDQDFERATVRVPCDDKRSCFARVEVTMQTPEDPPVRAEVFLSQDRLIQGMADFFPQGEVDRNPPWLHVRGNSILHDESGNIINQGEQWHRRYYFKLSKDPYFKKGVIESGPKRWGFFNPWQKLLPGTWYWTFGIAPDEASAPEWYKDYYAFTISGEEWDSPLPPSPEEFVQIVLEHEGPIWSMWDEDAGNILPDDWPELANRVVTATQSTYQADPSMVLSLGDLVFPAGYNSTNTPDSRFRALMFDAFLVKARHASRILKGGVILNRPDYIARGIQKFYEHRNYFDNGALVNPSTGTEFLMRKLWAPRPGLETLVDLVPAHMTPAQLETAVSEAYPPNHSGPVQMDLWADLSWDQHMWQLAQTKLHKPLIFARYSSVAREELKWAYELLMYRGPVLSRTDGGSQDGDCYLGPHTGRLCGIPWVIYRLTGYNIYKSHPWYPNSAKFLTYTNPFGNTGAEYADGDPPAANMSTYAEFLARLHPDDPMTLWFFNKYNPGGLNRPDTVNGFASDILDKGDSNLMLLALWKRTPSLDFSRLQAPTENAAVFRDIGIASMHTSLTQESSNFELDFISNPYGSVNHTHPCQNAFSIAYGGEHIFTRTGFYQEAGRAHNLLSYKTSLAHNTIVADGLMQGFSPSAYGWMARFAHGERISYALGDASKAYDSTHPFIYPAGRFVADSVYDGVDINRANGFGPPPGVTKFRRHIAMLRPHDVVIYDELEAVNPITWEFRLHSRTWMGELGPAWLIGTNQHAAASAKLFCMDPLQTSLTDQFRGPPIDGSRPGHFHAGIKTSAATAKTRFLTVIKVHPGQGQTYVPVEPQGTYAGGMFTISLGDYTVKAQMDANQPSFLEARHNSGTAALVTGSAAKSLEMGGVTKTMQYPGSTLLKETSTSKGDVLLEVKDEVPDIVKFGKSF